MKEKSGDEQTRLSELMRQTPTLGRYPEGRPSILCLPCLSDWWWWLSVIVSMIEKKHKYSQRLNAFFAQCRWEGEGGRERERERDFREMIKRVGFMGIGDADHDNWLTLFFIIYSWTDWLREVWDFVHSSTYPAHPTSPPPGSFW